MIPLETAYRNRIRINEFPMQELHCGIKRINVEGEGNNRRTVMQFSGGAALANASGMTVKSAEIFMHPVSLKRLTHTRFQLTV